MRMPEEQLPKLSAGLNNCPVHALTPEITQQVALFASNADYNNGNNPEYNRLKTTFAEYYEIEPETFNWQDFNRTLQHYNAWDVQHVLGPVLRKHMENHVPKDRIELTEFNRAIGRYNMLILDEVAQYIASPLGLQIKQGFRPDPGMSENEFSEFEQVANEDLLQKGPQKNVIAEIVLFHNDDRSKGAGHFERTNEAQGSREFAEEEKQLSSIMSLVTSGDDPLRSDNGLALLKLDVQTAFKSPDQPTYLANTEAIKEAAKEIEHIITQETMTYEFALKQTSEQAKVIASLSQTVTSKILEQTGRVGELPSVPVAGPANLSTTAAPRAHQASLEAQSSRSADTILSHADPRDDLKTVSLNGTKAFSANNSSAKSAPSTSTTQGPSTKTDPLASLALKAAIVRSNQLTRIEQQNEFINQLNTTPEPDKQKNLEKMFTALIILNNRGVFEVKPSDNSSVKSQQEQDEEMARQLQKEEFEIEQQGEDSVFRPRR